MIRIALAQQDFLVGDIKGNLCKAIELINGARERGADLLLFPELALAGYPPEDLLLRPGFLENCHEAMQNLAEATRGVDVVIGHPWVENRMRYNCASWIRDGRIVGRYFKQHLPNYAVFDEQRYFTPGSQPLVIDVKGVNIGVIICEDAWEQTPAVQAREQGAELLLVPNASPYRDDKLDARKRMFADQYAQIGLPMVYCNLVGGQDELVFDGRSMLMDGQGRISDPGPLCDEALLLAEFDPGRQSLIGRDWKSAPADQLEEIYKVLLTGVR
ncbi:MAG: NAD+ synthase, partial [Gammaproteobacteria bacterium]|nr:NAD+ synthase [Gammaproteobacteria bacterium]